MAMTLTAAIMMVGNETGGYIRMAGGGGLVHGVALVLARPQTVAVILQSRNGKSFIAIL